MVCLGAHKNHRASNWFRCRLCLKLRGSQLCNDRWRPVCLSLQSLSQLLAGERSAVWVKTHRSAARAFATGARATHRRRMLAGHGGQFPGRTDQDRNDNARFGRLDWPAQGLLVSGMSDDGCSRRDFFRIGDQPLILRGGRAPEQDHCRHRADRAVSEHLRSVIARCPRPL